MERKLMIWLVAQNNPMIVVDKPQEEDTVHKVRTEYGESGTELEGESLEESIRL